MSAANFLKDLPTYNQENFSKIHEVDVSQQTPTKGRRQTKYVPTDEYSPDEQEIVTEKLCEEKLSTLYSLASRIYPDDIKKINFPRERI